MPPKPTSFISAKEESEPIPKAKPVHQKPIVTSDSTIQQSNIIASGETVLGNGAAQPSWANVVKLRPVVPKKMVVAESKAM